MRDVMEYDVVIVGAGVAGLSSAIHLKQLAMAENKELSVCILDKASEVGGHIISGCIMDTRAISELIPNWQTELDFNYTKVSEDKFEYLSTTKAYSLPIPKTLYNHGNIILSLSQFTRALGHYAENLGVEIYPSFAIADVIIEQNIVKGVICGDMGIAKDGSHIDDYQLGMSILAKQTVFAEGARGSVTKQVIKEFNLTAGKAPQTYGLGVKEVWQVASDNHNAGKVLHTIGYPLDNSTYGGGFLYHLENNIISIGFITGLDYSNTFFNPYDEFQKFKQHPEISKVLHNGKRLEYGARIICEGGLQSLPKLSFAGGILVGDSAGFLNVARIKGSHAAIKSGMLGAESVYQAISNSEIEANTYQDKFKKSWLYTELNHSRNIRPAFQHGLVLGALYSVLEQFIFKRALPWTFKTKMADYKRLHVIEESKKLTYHSYDKKITFDKTSSLFLANLSHNDNQPVHLKVKDAQIIKNINTARFANPETRYCPAGVYEMINNELHINAQNCLHCKACDVKDPMQNIVWTTPEGGSGPQYSNM